MRVATGEKIEIINPGQHNFDAGPDFFNAKIKIGGILWIGNVEIHVRASDWKRHVHHDDKAYDNVVLHVVLEADAEAFRSNGQPIPVFVMTFDAALNERYEALLAAPTPVPCAPHLKNIQPIEVSQFLSRLLVERLEKKSGDIRQTLAATGNEWNAAFYQLLFRTFGFSVNGAAFERLAKAVPHAVVGKHRHSVLQLEALLFGQAGMLQDTAKDDYQAALQKEYRFLQEKFRLTPLEPHLWRFLRLRPSNFPTVRLAQLAQLLHQAPPLVELMEAWNGRAAAAICTLFDVQASEYWDTHFTFGKPSPAQPKKLGATSIHTLMINLVIPYLFTYAQQHGYDGLQDTALDLLEQFPPETNHITACWEQAGIKAHNAFYSQALLQLQTAYCDRRRCLHCRIGAGIISTKWSVRGSQNV